MKKNNIKNLVRQHIVAMKPYSSARAEYTGDDAVFLDANENPIGSVTQELHNRYPDPLQVALKERLAIQENLTAQQIFIGNGSDECIDVLIRAFCEPKEDAILVCPPVFSMYEHAAHSQNVSVIEVLLKNNFQLQVDEILHAILQENLHTKIIFICSPNNPTGNLINEEDIIFLLNNFVGLVVIDEAYQDFAQNESWTKQLSVYQNLVVIKTFSKAYGMADARLGMLFAHEEIIHYMNTIKLPYNVNKHSQLLAQEAIENQHKKNEFVSYLIIGRNYLESELSKIPYIHQIFPSDANYILFKVDDANALYLYLIQHKIVVRNRDNSPLLKGCLRVSVGTKEENNRFIEVLKKYS